MIRDYKLQLLDRKHQHRLIQQKKEQSHDSLFGNLMQGGGSVSFKSGASQTQQMAEAPT